MAGSWITGGANQAAMKEVFDVGDEVFSAMIAVDVLVTSIWMAVLLFMAGESQRIDQRRGADTSALDDLKRRGAEFQERHVRIASMPELMAIAAVGFGVTDTSHVLADLLAPWLEQSAPGLARLSLTSQFFWLVVIATTGGCCSPAPGCGSSKVPAHRSWRRSCCTSWLRVSAWVWTSAQSSIARDSLPSRRCGWRFTPV